MKEKITWEEMQKRYPKEWLVITNFKLDQYGEVAQGVVLRHSKDKDEVCQAMEEDLDLALLYTGPINFSGFRSHYATH